MIKSIKFKNWSCFLNEQHIEVSRDKNDFYKRTNNFIFGLPSQGKTAIFTLIKTTIFYMRRWLNYGDDSILKSQTMGECFNPNIETQIVPELENLTEIELVFENETYSFKYELAFNKEFCKYEKLSYKINDILDEWIELFDKSLIDYVDINNKIETIYETYVNIEELELDYTPTFKGINQLNSILPYIESITKSEHVIEFAKIIKKIDFYEAKDFQNFRSYLFPFKEILENKEEILALLDEVKLKYDDFDLGDECKMTGNYSINLFRKDSKKQVIKSISSSKLSKGEIKLFLYVALFNKYKSSNDSIIFIDDFSDSIPFEIFFNIIKRLENETDSMANSQLFAINNHFFNKLLQYKSDYFNIFDISKDDNGYSKIVRKNN